jgi:hypothetical protein
MYELTGEQILDSLRVHIIPIIGARCAGDEKYQEWGWKTFLAFEKYLRVPGGKSARVASDGAKTGHTAHTLQAMRRCGTCVRQTRGRTIASTAWSPFSSPRLSSTSICCKIPPTP